MSLDLHFFKKDVDFNQIRSDIDALTDKRRTIEEELERLEDDYEDAKLASHNVTHNLFKMAEAVGLDKVLWNPEQIGITSAFQMIAPLETAIKELEANPENTRLLIHQTVGGTMIFSSVFAGRYHEPVVKILMQ